MYCYFVFFWFCISLQIILSSSLGELFAEVVGTDEMAISPEPILIPCTQYVDVWVSWEGGRLMVGRGRTPLFDVLLTLTPEKPFPVRGIALATALTGTWRFNKDASMFPILVLL